MLSEIKFQYILCYGSTKSGLTFSIKRPDFNTSYVTVQRMKSA